MSSSSSRTALTVATVTVVGGLVAYAVYFDYKRRNDVTFRKKLRTSFNTTQHHDVTNSCIGKEKKKVDKTAAQEKEVEVASGRVDSDAVREALFKVRAEEVPNTPEQKEQYFMAQVGMGEQICTQGRLDLVALFTVTDGLLAGPEYNLQAAMCFYRALRVYPSPVELIQIYQKTVPEAVFNVR